MRVYHLFLLAVAAALGGLAMIEFGTTVSVIEWGARVATFGVCYFTAMCAWFGGFVGRAPLIAALEEIAALPASEGTSYRAARIARAALERAAA